MASQPKVFRPVLVPSAQKRTGMKPRPPVEGELEENILPPDQGEPFDTSELLGKRPEMPLEAFPTPVRQAILNIAACKGTAPEMVGAFFLGLSSACIGRARSVSYSKDWNEAANLYILVVAETGEGKSPTQKYVFRELAHIEAVTKAIYREERQQYEEDVIAFRKHRPSKKNDGERAPEMPKRPPNIQYMLDDSTLEAAVELLYDNPRGLCWLVDEFGGFFNSLDRYSAKGGPSEGKRRLLSAWDGKTISMSRKSKDGISNEIYVERATLSVCGCIQPHLLRKTFTYDDLMQGQPQRFLFVDCPPQKPLMLPTPEIPDAVRELISKITRAMLGLAMEERPDGRRVGVKIDMTDGAKRAFQHFNNALVKQAYGTPMKGWGKKIVGNTLRLSLILHYMRHACEGNPCDGEITFEDMNAAVMLADYFYGQAQMVQAILPSVTGEVDPKAHEAEIAARRLAPILLQHAKDIEKLDHKVQNKHLQAWLKKAKTKVDFKAAQDWLKAKEGRSNQARWRVISPEILAICAKLEEKIPSVFEPEKDDAEE